MSAKLFCLLLAAGLAGIAASAHAEILDARGKVLFAETSSGKACIARANGESTKAYADMFLYANDQIEVSGDAVVIVRVDGHRRRLTRDSPQSDRVVSPHAPALLGVIDERYLESLRLLFAKGRNEPPTFFISRGEPPALREDLLAPSGSQLLPKELDHLALLWVGGIGEVSAAQPSGPSVLGNSGNSNWLSTPIKQGVHILEVRPLGIPSTIPATIRWSIERWTGPPPRPSWMNAADEGNAPGRTVRALWLLANKPQWHLFALTELADLSAVGYFPADELWRAARQGTLAPELAKLPDSR